MDRELYDKLDAMDTKLDRILDPERGVYAKLAAHEARDAVKHRTIYLVMLGLAAVGAGAAGLPGLARALMAALG